MADPDNEHKSLWRELADGTAGPVVRLIITFALAAVMSAVCLFGAFLLAALVPQWNYTYTGSSGIRPRDELLAWLFGGAALIYLVAICWLWSRNTKHRGLWFAGVLTIVIIAVAIAIGALMESLLTGAEELVFGGIALVAIASILLVWLHAWRRFMRGRPRKHETDGLLDLRCPACNYRMVGLHESRCPECGAMFTLEELLAKQGFRKG